MVRKIICFNCGCFFLFAWSTLLCWILSIFNIFNLLDAAMIKGDLVTEQPLSHIQNDLRSSLHMAETSVRPIPIDPLGSQHNSWFIRLQQFLNRPFATLNIGTHVIICTFIILVIIFALENKLIFRLITSLCMICAYFGVASFIDAICKLPWPHFYLFTSRPKLARSARCLNWINYFVIFNIYLCLLFLIFCVWLFLHFVFLVYSR